MIIQNRDGSLMTEPPNQWLPQSTDPSYRVEIPVGLLDEQSSLIERVIAFAFDTLGAHRLDVRVRECE